MIQLVLKLGLTLWSSQSVPLLCMQQCIIKAFQRIYKFVSQFLE